MSSTAAGTIGPMGVYNQHHPRMFLELTRNSGALEIQGKFFFWRRGQKCRLFSATTMSTIRHCAQEEKQHQNNFDQPPSSHVTFTFATGSRFNPLKSTRETQTRKMGRGQEDSRAIWDGDGGVTFERTRAQDQPTQEGIHSSM